MQVHIANQVYQFLWCTHVYKTSRFESERVFYVGVTIIVAALLEEAPQPMSAEDYSHIEQVFGPKLGELSTRIRITVKLVIWPTVSLLN